MTFALGFCFVTNKDYSAIVKLKHICFNYSLDIVRLNGYTYMRSKMFEYMTAQEAAEKWNVSLRWVQRLCKENRIDGAMNFNRVWLIPKVAKKPVDKRRKVTNYEE